MPGHVVVFQKMIFERSEEESPKFRPFEAVSSPIQRFGRFGFTRIHTTPVKPGASARIRMQQHPASSTRARRNDTQPRKESESPEKNLILSGSHPGVRLLTRHHISEKSSTLLRSSSTQANAMNVRFDRRPIHIYINRYLAVLITI
ncbi:hypothetical protein Tco_0058428 [Tanacetum coccineum]